MTKIVSVLHGEPVPNTLHAISVHISTWKAVCDIASGDKNALDALKNGYPRSFIHKSIQRLSENCQRAFFAPDARVMLFSNPEAALACKAYMNSNSVDGLTIFPARSDIITQAISFACPGVPKHSIHLPIIYAVVYPDEFHGLGTSFWRLTGTGISSRLAERCLEASEGIHLIDKTNIRCSLITHSAFEYLQARIAELLERAPVGTSRHFETSPGDVYLYPSGMSAIYHAHHLLLQWRGTESIVFGFTYELTLKLIETYGSGTRFYSAGTDSDLDDLEYLLRQKRAHDTKIQAVWCECPSNPLLRTVNLSRLKLLADDFDFVLVVDDTIGSFANIDVLGVADILITSLSKSFNGFADVLAGSVVLNPNSRHYHALKDSLDASYMNNVHIDDALQLLQNSRSYLERQALMNETADYIVDRIQLHMTNKPSSVLTNIYYPRLCWSAENYRAQMRVRTPDFTPGYGWLFTIQFVTVETAQHFLDSVDLYKGPSIGAHVTLVLPYVQMVFQKQKDWAARHGVHEAIVRISVGLEDKEIILSCILDALKRAQDC